MDPRRDPRMAGCVVRWHTWPHLRQQTVAEHTWQYLRVLVAIWREAPREVLVAVLVHDVGEVAAGDSPYPAKKDNPALGREVERVERKAHMEMCLPWSLPAWRQLSPEHAAICKLAEFIEMWEDGLQELMLGNRFARPVVERCMEGVMATVLRVQQYDLLEIASEAMRYVARRTAEWAEVAK